MTTTRSLIALVAAVGCLSGETALSPLLRVKRVHIEKLAGDTIRGKQVFATICAVCHGPDGQGTAVAPPLWGPKSFNIGAGMSRLHTAARFIHQLMPRDRPGILTPQQAYDAAAYVVSRPRPDFPGKENDWPKGGAPSDVAYPTRAAKSSPSR